MKDKILAALKELDPTDDALWTSEGQPKVDALKLEGVTRAMITEVAPRFTRFNVELETPAEKEDEAKEAARKEAELDIDGKLAALQDKIDAKGKELAAGRKEYDALLAQHDALIREKDNTNAGRTVQHDIQAYLKHQNEMRKARAAARR